MTRTGDPHMTDNQIRPPSSSTARRSPLPGLLVAQFFGAFNDNAFKMVIALLAIDATLGHGEAEAQQVTTMAFVVFTLPLMLGSVPAMAFGDRVGKRSLLVATKLAELILMIGGALALWWQPTGLLPLVVLAGMGLQSAFFSPAKYGILPESLPHDQLARANGRLEAASFLAIILGTVAGGVLLRIAGAEVWLAGVLLAALSLVGLVAAMRVPPVPASGSSEPVAATIAAAWRAVRGDRTLWLATLGSL
ncbi:MAG: MFS transporter, partial [Planctomycetes bacterium]|nr:MFS transporter [Planctomycetota bacterium]